MNPIEYIRNKNALWYKVALYLFSVSLVVAFLPKVTYFPYNLNEIENKIWMNDNVIAPYEFSIYKDDKQIKNELDSVLANTRVYLNESDEVFNQWQIDFKHWLQLNGNNAIVKSYLDSCTQIGIVDYADSSLLKRGKGQAVVLIKKQVASDILLAQLMDISVVEMRLNFLLSNNEYALAELKKILVPTCKVDLEFTKQNVSEAIVAINRTSSKITKDEVLVRRNERISPLIYSKLLSYKKEFEIQNAVEKNFWIILLGQAMYTGLCMSIIFVFLATFRKNIFSQNRQITFVVIVILFFVLISTYVARIGNAFIYFIH
jgi:cyclic-di-AMP phosphodiesterase PgpH